MGLRKLRTITLVFLLSLGIFSLAVAGLRAADISSGSGVVIGSKGEILTNAHVVERCAAITVQFSTGNSEAAVLVARDEKNDLAVIRSKTLPSSVAAFRDGAPLRAGDTVVALGYPLSGLLASSANLSVGNVSALAGLGDDPRYLQISAPVQPGNSGGPLLDASGHLVGIVTGKLNAAQVARFTGDIPQNVNFALKAELARTFVESRGITYLKARSEQQLAPADVGDIGRPFTVHIQCKQDRSRSVSARSIRAPQLPAGVDPQNTILIDTKYGRIAIELRKDLAPAHAERIKRLAREKYYDNVPFHRVIADFLAQTGDGARGDGAGGSQYPNLPPEFSSVPFKRGVVGMARTKDLNSANSQFFIMFAEIPSMNGQYTVVGEVISGMDVVDKIKKGSVSQNGAVLEPDRMLRVQVAADASPAPYNRSKS
jgi:peptidylprolyl isomerase